ncbi:MAG: hypothetical protein FWE05_07775 [Defluviitaleaceae bacterium]|nr:hypothetical protein [Defluviitaleaceae bacterium]
MKRITMKFFAVALVLTMVFVSTPAVHLMAQTATPASYVVYVDGQPVEFNTFTISGNDFFMLRDLAYAFNGTSYQFDVVWDANLSAITLVLGQAYTPVGGEMTTGGTAVSVISSTAVVYVDGVRVDFRTYNIDGNNFFMLSELGVILGFGVTTTVEEPVVPEPEVETTPEEVVEATPEAEETAPATGVGSFTAIFDDYSARIRAATPGAMDELRAAAAGLADPMEILAIYTEIGAALITIGSEGGAAILELHIMHGVGTMDSAMAYVDRLAEVSIEEVDKLAELAIELAFGF